MAMFLTEVNSPSKKNKLQELHDALPYHGAVSFLVCGRSLMMILMSRRPYWPSTEATQSSDAQYGRGSAILNITCKLKSQGNCSAFSPPFFIIYFLDPNAPSPAACEWDIE